jgi:hypothetical protein
MDARPTIKERVPYAPTADGPLIMIRSVLAQYRDARCVTLDMRLPYLLVDRAASPEEVANKSPLMDGPRTYDLVREHIKIQEYDPEGETDPYRQLVGMFSLIAEEGLVVSHILVGSMEALRKWVKFPRRHTSLLGSPIYVLEPVPVETIILCGSVRHDGEAEDVQYALKGTIA